MLAHNPFMGSVVGSRIIDLVASCLHYALCERKDREKEKDKEKETERTKNECRRGKIAYIIELIIR